MSSDAPAGRDPPRLLLIDHARRGGPTGSGRLTQALLGGWPQGRFAQLWRPRPGGFALAQADGRCEALAAEAIPDAIAAFAPDLMLYRAVPAAGDFHETACALIETPGRPFALWLTQDWPEVGTAGAALSLSSLARRAAARFAAGAMLCAALEARCGVGFVPVSHAVDEADWPLPAARLPGPFRLRHIGGIGARRNRDSLLRVAQAVEALAGEGRAIALELCLRPEWQARFAADFAGLARTRIATDDGAVASHRRWLAEADATLFCLDFGAEARAAGLPLPEALPELLAAGHPLLFHGPTDGAVAAQLAATGCGLLVTEPSSRPLAVALAQLLDDPDLVAGLAARGREVAFGEHAQQPARARFEAALAAAAAAAAPVGLGAAVDLAARRERLVAEAGPALAALRSPPEAVPATSPPPAAEEVPAVPAAMAPAAAPAASRPERATARRPIGLAAAAAVPVLAALAFPGPVTVTLAALAIILLAVAVLAIRRKPTRSGEP